MVCGFFIRYTETGQNVLQLKVALMKKYLLLLLPIFITTVCCAQDISEIVNEASKSVVMIQVYDATGALRGQGSGVFVDNEGTILTNEHVIEGAYSAEVITADTTYEDVVIFYKNAKKDLALIKIYADSFTTIPITFAENTDFKSGHRVIAIGNPLGLEKSVSEGLISGIRKTEDSTEYIQTTVPISPGSSGGALLDSYGALIGITTSTYSDGQNINFAISLNTINIFIDEYINIKDKYSHIKTLKPAKTRLWYRIVLKWFLGVIIFIISLLFSGSFYWALPLVVLVCYAFYYLIKGIIWLAKLPFVKYHASKAAKNVDSADQAIFNYYANDTSDYAQTKLKLLKLKGKKIQSIEEIAGTDNPYILIVFSDGSKITFQYIGNPNEINSDIISTFHKLWSKNVGSDNYLKTEWSEFAHSLEKRGIVKIKDPEQIQ